MTPNNRFCLLLVLFTASSSYAAPSGVEGTPESETAVRELAPAQLSAIRAIGRNVLAAKKSAVEDPADAEQLGRLRAAVNALVAAELDAGGRATITVQGATAQGSEAPARPQARVLAVERRDTARTDARAIAAQLRQHGDVLASRALAGAESGTSLAGTTSAGLPVAGQRAQLFARLAQKLDAALVDGEPERLTMLTELRDQLDTRKGRLHEAPPLGTPTLQAIPSTSKTPIRAVSASEVKPPPPIKAKLRKSKAQ